MSVITPMRMVSANWAQETRDEKASVVKAAAATALPPMNCRRVMVMVFLPLFLFSDGRALKYGLCHSSECSTYPMAGRDRSRWAAGTGADHGHVACSPLLGFSASADI